MKLALILTFLLSFSAFAGDSYFICENDTGYRIIDAYIGDSELIEDSYYNLQDDYYTFKFNTQTFKMEVVHSDIHTGNLINVIEETLEYYEPVKISEEITCLLAD